MTTEARAAGVVARRIHLVVAIDRLLARLLAAAPHGSWVVKGGYANQLRRPDSARFTEDLDLKIDAAIEAAPELLAAGFAVDADDDFTYEVAAAAAPLQGPPGGGLRFVVVARLAGTQLVRFKVDVSAADVVVGDLEEYLSDPVVARLGFQASRFPVYPIAQHVAEKLHALTLPRDVENTRGNDNPIWPHRDRSNSPDHLPLKWGQFRLSHPHPRPGPRRPGLVHPALHFPIRCAHRRVRCDVRTPRDPSMAAGAAGAAGGMAATI